MLKTWKYFNARFSSKTEVFKRLSARRVIFTPRRHTVELCENHGLVWVILYEVPLADTGRGGARRGTDEVGGDG